MYCFIMSNDSFKWREGVICHESAFINKNTYLKIKMLKLKNALIASRFCIVCIYKMMIRLKIKIRAY